MAELTTGEGSIAPITPDDLIQVTTLNPTATPARPTFALAQLITKSARGQVSVGQRTVANAVEAGLCQAEREGLEPTTLRSHRTSAECHVLPAFGSRRLSTPERGAPRPLLRRVG